MDDATRIAQLEQQLALTNARIDAMFACFDAFNRRAELDMDPINDPAPPDHPEIIPRPADNINAVPDPEPQPGPDAEPEAEAEPEPEAEYERDFDAYPPLAAVPAPTPDAGPGHEPEPEPDDPEPELELA
jgi:hypothetical protein